MTGYNPNVGPMGFMMGQPQPDPQLVMLAEKLAQKAPASVGAQLLGPAIQQQQAAPPQPQMMPQAMAADQAPVTGANSENSFDSGAMAQATAAGPAPATGGAPWGAIAQMLMASQQKPAPMAPPPAIIPGRQMQPMQSVSGVQPGTQRPTSLASIFGVR